MFKSITFMYFILFSTQNIICTDVYLGLECPLFNNLASKIRSENKYKNDQQVALIEIKQI